MCDFVIADWKIGGSLTIKKRFLHEYSILCRYLGWDVSQETFYIKSVQNKETSLERQVRTFCFSLKDFLRYKKLTFFIFPGRYHSKHSDALGYLSCFSIADSGDFRDQ